MKQKTLLSVLIGFGMVISLSASATIYTQSSLNTGTQATLSVSAPDTSSPGVGSPGGNFQAANFGDGSGVLPPTVPEPSGVSLAMLAGIAGAAFRRWRKP